MIHACGSPSCRDRTLNMAGFHGAAAPDNKSVQDGWLNRTAAPAPRRRQHKPVFVRCR